MRRKQIEIEEGLYEDNAIFNDSHMFEGKTKEEIAEELEAHGELREFAEAIKRRQENVNKVDVAELVVDNKVLINRVDDLLNQKHTADDGPTRSFGDI